MEPSKSFFKRIFGLFSSNRNDSAGSLTVAPANSGSTMEFADPTLSDSSVTEGQLSEINGVFQVIDQSKRIRSEFYYAPNGGENDDPIINSVEITEECNELDLAKVVTKMWDRDKKCFVETSLVMPTHEAHVEIDTFDMQPTLAEDLAHDAAIDEMQEREFNLWCQDNTVDQKTDDDVVEWDRDSQIEWTELEGQNNRYVSYLLSANEYNSLDNTYACIWIEAVDGKGQVKVIETVHNTYTDAESRTESVLPMNEALERISSYMREAIDIEHAKLRGEDQINIENQLDPLDDFVIPWIEIPAADRKCAVYTEEVESSPVVTREIEILARSGSDVKVEQRTRFDGSDDVYITRSILSEDASTQLFNSYLARQALSQMVEMSSRPTSLRA